MPEKLPEDIFLSTFKNVPRIACNLIIENGKGELLLAKRANPPGIGFWHYPGGFLLKNETIMACLKRIAHDELGYVLPKDPTLVGVFENLAGDPHGHVIDILYKLQLPNSLTLSATRYSKELRFFLSLPEHIGFGQGNILKQIGYS